MKSIKAAADFIENGGLNDQLAVLYGKDKNELEFQKSRYIKALLEFKNMFGIDDKTENDIRILSVPGRSEISGNHTDHNYGRVMACSVNLDIVAVTCENSSGTVKIKSEGFDCDIVELNDLSVKPEDKYRSKGLIRGILARLNALGFKTGGGFNAYTTSAVLKGSGLSSSAAFEVMVATIINVLYYDGKVDPVVVAQVGQFAEREYFGKPCGLMDQAACAVGGLIAMDFADNNHPEIKKIDFNFSDTNKALCIVNTGGNHADLNEDYSSIQFEMKQIAKLMGHEVLRQCNENEFFNRIGDLRQKAGDRAVLRAIHYFEENERVSKQVNALKSSDFNLFEELVIESGQSSCMFLQNSYSIKSPSEQGITLALALAARMLKNKGSWRVHGGGFAGTIQAFVPYSMVREFSAAMDGAFGKGACHCLLIRPIGACSVL